MVQLIITQVITLAIQCYIATTKRIKNILFVTFLFNFANLVCYAFNSDIWTVVTYSVICVRSFIYIYRDKLKAHDASFIVPLLFVFTHLLLGFNDWIESGHTFMNSWRILTIFAACWNCYYMWYYDTAQKLRIGNIVSNGTWFAYNVITELYIIAAGRILAVAANFVAYIKNKRVIEHNN